MKESLRNVLFVVGALLAHTNASGAIISTQYDDDLTSSGFVDDGAVGVGEYSAVYANGGGGGFGGAVGGGTIYMDSDNTNLYIGYQPGASLNDNAVLFLDTRSGGFADADMDDTADPGRNLSSNLTRDVNDVMPVGADFSVIFGGFGTVMFELNAGNSPGHLQFHIFQGDQVSNDPSIVREIAIPLALLGNPTKVDFFMAYGSDTNFMSNESLPASPLNGAGNPGFDNGGSEVTYENANRFVIPEPSTMLLGLGCLLAVAFPRPR